MTINDGRFSSDDGSSEDEYRYAGGHRSSRAESSRSHRSDLFSRSARRFKFDAYDPKVGKWADYEEALLMALHQQGILNPAEQKVAFFLSLSQAVRGEVAAHFAPARVLDQSVTFEDVLRYFRRINDQLYTHQMARRDFAACRQGDLSIDDWVKELRRLAGMCRFADPDERLLDAIVSGARSASLRERLAEFASSTEAYNFARRWERARRESSYKLDAPDDLKPR